MRGEVKYQSRMQPEQRLFAFLSEVSDAASGRLAPNARSRFVDGLRQTIQAERERLGMDSATLERILGALGDAVTLVDAEVQRDPDYQAKLSARLSRPVPGPQVPITDDLAELIAPAARPSGARGAPPAVSGPEICLDPDPFAPDHSVETVGALAGPSPTAVISEIEADEYPAAPTTALGERLRTVWQLGARMHPQEAIAIGLFLAGAVLGQWLALVVAALVACTSRFFTEAEKWVLVIAVPIGTALFYTFGFWLMKRGFPGGVAKGTTVNLMDGAASFYGTLPRMAALLAALYLIWRLARGITRQL
jgi:hypothetical protein